MYNPKNPSPLNFLTSSSFEAQLTEQMIPSEPPFPVTAEIPTTKLQIKRKEHLLNPVCCRDQVIQQTPVSCHYFKFSPNAFVRIFLQITSNRFISF